MVDTNSLYLGRDQPQEVGRIEKPTKASWEASYDTYSSSQLCMSLEIQSGNWRQYEFLSGWGLVWIIECWNPRFDRITPLKKFVYLISVGEKLMRKWVVMITAFLLKSRKSTLFRIWLMWIYRSSEKLNKWAMENMKDSMERTLIFSSLLTWSLIVKTLYWSVAS